MSIQVIAGAALLATALPVAWWAVGSTRTSTVAAANLRRGLSTTDVRAASLQESSADRVAKPLLAALALRARRITPAGMLDTLEGRVAASGMEHHWPLERVLAVKLLMSLAGGLVGIMQLAARPGILMALLAVFLVAGFWIAPDIMIGRRADARRAQARRELPDTMDQVTIAVEAGLGFEAALARIADAGDGVLAGEIARTLQDIQLGVARAEALEGMALRLDIPELRHFVTAVRQAERYGLPIANVLRVQSTELREKRRQRAEEHAMKIPVKVLFPLVFFILPTLFIVILGPAGIRMAESGFGG